MVARVEVCGLSLLVEGDDWFRITLVARFSKLALALALELVLAGAGRLSKLPGVFDDEGRFKRLVEAYCC